MPRPRPPFVRFVTALGPGILVAATGVGAGDLATAGLAGTHVGLSILWVVLVGAFIKFVLNEGIARWQLATRSSILEGVARHLAPAATWIFLAYLVYWTFFVSAALMSVAGIVLGHLIPIFEEPRTAKIVFGIAQSALGVALVLGGGYRLFERVMSVCVAVMFVTVVWCAWAIRPDWSAVFRGLVVPSLPAGGLDWTLALSGGIGGTVTVLCYGYWIREEGRTDATALGTCRIDLATGYAATAVFGVAMVIIGSSVTIPDGSNSAILGSITLRLGETLGPVSAKLFAVGAWGAVFSSLLGVWQSVPYLFADTWRLVRGKSRESVGERSAPYRAYLLFLATVPTIGLWVEFGAMQKAYGVVGALFIPLLGAALLALTTRERTIGAALRNHWATTVILSIAVTFYVIQFIREYVL